MDPQASEEKETQGMGPTGDEPFDAGSFIRSAGDGIVAAGPDGAILAWNPAAERIFGYTEQEALGRSLDLIIPERQRQRHWEGYDKVMRSGQTRYGTDVLRVRPCTKMDGPCRSPLPWRC